MRDEIKGKSLLPTQTRGLLNIFSAVTATTQQNHDLLNARKIGKEQFLRYVKYHLLNEPSTSAPIRKRRLLTLAEPSPRRTTQERELKVVEKCLRHRLAWCNKQGNSYDTGMEQYSIYPPTIAEIDTKGQMQPRQRRSGRGKSLQCLNTSLKPIIIMMHTQW